MNRTTFFAALVAAGLGAGAMAAPEPADAGGSFSLYFSPQSEKGQKKLSRGLRVFSHVQRHVDRGRGRDNTARVDQHGSGNHAGIYQRGDGHDASVGQYGHNNSFGVFQFGRDTNADVRQYGDGQSGLLFQHGW